jgi:2'-5' RNA ligase
MSGHLKLPAALVIGVAALLGYAETSRADDTAVTAVDIALEPDATMIDHAKAVNALLLKDFPEGFALDDTHHPHVTLLQQFVLTADLDKVYGAAGKVLAGKKLTEWKLKAFKYYYIPDGKFGLGGIVVEPTPELHQLQNELIEAVAPFTTKSGTPAAFISTKDGKDIQKSLIEYVANFTTVAAAEKFNPHVTIGVGTAAYLDQLLAQPFDAFIFSPVGASVYQLGTFGTARKELKALDLNP